MPLNCTLKNHFKWYLLGTFYTIRMHIFNLVQFSIIYYRMVISLSDGKIIFATSLLGEFALTLGSFSQIPSFSKTITLSRKWGNICECGSCLGLLMTDPTPPSHSPLHAGTSRVGEAEQRPQVQGEDRVQSRAKRGGRGMPVSLQSSYLWLPLTSPPPAPGRRPTVNF